MNMNRLINRRDALGMLGTVAATGTRVLGNSTGSASSPKTQLGVVIYALGVLRRRLKSQNATRDLFDAQEFLDCCHNLGAGGIQAQLGILNPDACKRLRTKAEQYGMFIEGIVEPPFQDADVKRFEAEIHTAAQVAAKAVRTVILPGRRYERFKSLNEYRQFAERGRQALKRAAPIVERHSVRLAVENHKDQRLEERLSLLRELKCPFIGACVDTGNSFALLEDPVSVVEALAPYAFSVHLKDQAVQEYDEGFLLADVALGDGFLDLQKMVDVLRSAQPNVHFSLETITRDPLKVPCLADRYWPTFADIRGKDLAQTLRVVRKNAAISLPQISNSSLEEQVELEQTIVRKSLQYARTHLGI
jgi:sugar phosphate isomerase/epimerase